MLLYELDNHAAVIVYNDELNPKLYDESGNMHRNVHAALIAVAKNFVADIDLPDMIVHDIILTGSSANFNWNKFSDVDLHLISDIDVFADPHMAAKYFTAAKNVWNNRHNVDIHGLDVEVYVEDNDEHNESLGRFSVMNNEWITKPVHNKPVFDEDAVNRKVRYIMKEIDMYLDDSDELDEIEHLKQKIWDMRKEGLEKARAQGKPGEFSVENLAFKVLRNMGYLDKILQALKDAEDRELSIREMKMNETFNFLKHAPRAEPIKMNGTTIGEVWYDNDGRWFGEHYELELEVSTHETDRKWAIIDIKNKVASRQVDLENNPGEARYWAKQAMGKA